jgi:cell division protein FtsQ
MLSWRRQAAALVVVSTSAAAFAFVIAIGFRLDLYVVERVVFEGHDRASATELRHLARIPNGTHVFALDLDRSQRGAASHPWVESATVRFEWPATVRIAVTERRAVALVRGERLAYVDPQGAQIAAANTDDLDYPVLTGLTPELAALHPELPQRVVREALALIDLLADQGGVPRDRVAEVAFSGTSGFTVHLVGGARLLFALDDLARQVARLPALRERGVSLDRPIHIDLGPPTVAIVRPIEVPRVGS